MSIWTDIEKIGVKIGDFFTSVVKFGGAIQQVWGSLGPATLATASQVFYDVIKTAALAGETAADGSAGNWAGAVTLSTQTLASVNKLVADAKAGEKQVVADFDALKLALK